MQGVVAMVDGYLFRFQRIYFGCLPLRMVPSLVFGQIMSPKLGRTHSPHLLDGRINFQRPFLLISAEKLPSHKNNTEIDEMSQ